MAGDLLHQRGDDTPALIEDDGNVVSYAGLEARVAEAGDALHGASLLLLVGRNDVDTVTHYLASLAAGVVPLLLGAGIGDAQLAALIETYCPDLVFAPASHDGPPRGFRPLADRGRYRLYARQRRDGRTLHPDLALLLPTSGSTGSPKLVRLSRRNLISNAESIASYLSIGPGERAITTLPYNYSYGLSVINSHLHAGATVILNNRPLVDRAFWDALRREQASSLAGVPYTYDTLLKLGLERIDMPSVKTLTQAGGRLGEAQASRVGHACAARGMRFFVMYGQTEATARMTYLDPQHLQAKLGSIGRPIPGGSLQLRDTTGSIVSRPNAIGELVYTGENVSLGYSRTRDDLARGDDNHGVLATGDLARVDEDGFYYIVGRTSRFLKLFGVRVSLDDVERLLAGFGHQAAATGVDDRLTIAVAGVGHDALPQLRLRLAQTLGVHASAVRLLRCDEIPRLSSGKVDYAWIEQTT